MLDSIIYPTFGIILTAICFSALVAAVFFAADWIEKSEEKRKKK